MRVRWPHVAWPLQLPLAWMLSLQTSDMLLLVMHVPKRQIAQALPLRLARTLQAPMGLAALHAHVRVA